MVIFVVVGSVFFCLFSVFLVPSVASIDSLGFQFLLLPPANTLACNLMKFACLVLCEKCSL